MVLRGLALCALAGCGRLGFDGGGAGDAAGSDTASPLTYRDAVLADHPIAYWRLGEAAATFDDLPSHSFPGTAMGVVTRAQGGLYPGDDAAVSMDGVTGFIDVADDPALMLTSALTIEAWIDGLSFDHAAAGGFPRIVHKGPTGNTGYGLMIDQSSTGNTTGHLRLELEGTGNPAALGATLIVPNTTYHVAGTWDGAVMKVFVNGEVDAVDPFVGTLPVNNAAFEIGRRDDDLRYWAGTLDDVAIYDHALTPAQIAAHYAAAK